MCLSNIFYRITQNWIELTGWEMYESYWDENYSLPGSIANSTLLNSKIEEKQDVNENKKNAALEVPVFKIK